MPTFSMDELKQSFGLSSASDARQKAKSSPVETGEAVGQVRRDRRRTKDDSERLIREFLWAQDDWVLFLDICDALNRRPNRLLRQIVNDMVASGELLQEVDHGAGPLIPRHLYRVNRS